MLAHGRDESEGAPIHEERVAACLGGQVRGHLLNFEGRTEDLEVSGYLVSPEVTRRDTQGLRLTVNGRWVSDRILTQTIKAAYGPYLEPGRYPLCVLHLTLPKDTVDFNVHPQKSEVRISNRREVQAQLVRLITVFLVTKRPAAMFGKASSVQYAMNRDASVNRENTAPRDWFPAPQNHGEAPAPKAITHLSEDHAPGGAPLMGRYTFLETGEEMWLLDVHQFLRFELEQRLKTQLEAGSLTKQRLLFPLQVDAPKLDEANLEATENALDVMGFEISIFDEDKWMLKSMPSAGRGKRTRNTRVLHAILNGQNQDLKTASRMWLEKLVAPVTPTWRDEEWPGIKSRALQQVQGPVARVFCVPIEEQSLPVPSREENDPQGSVDRRGPHREWEKRWPLNWRKGWVGGSSARIPVNFTAAWWLEPPDLPRPSGPRCPIFVPRVRPRFTFGRGAVYSTRRSSGGRLRGARTAPHFGWGHWLVPAGVAIRHR